MVVTSIGRKGRLFTYADLEDLPDDGDRYELSNGALIVTPAPNTRHQALMVSIAAFLHASKPPSQKVLAEAELLIQPDMVKRPDVQVVDQNLVGGQAVVGTPALVVEIHSPATKVMDLTEKRSVYANAGIPAYWMVDPDGRTLTVLHLVGKVYEKVTVVEATGSFLTDRPFTMTIDGSAVFGA